MQFLQPCYRPSDASSVPERLQKRRNTGQHGYVCRSGVQPGDLTAMLGSAIATSISDIPFDGPCATTQVGLIDGEFVINPTPAQKDSF